jgi:hypothetical protein
VVYYSKLRTEIKISLGQISVILWRYFHLWYPEKVSSIQPSTDVEAYTSSPFHEGSIINYVAELVYKYGY